MCTLWAPTAPELKSASVAVCGAERKKGVGMEGLGKIYGLLHCCACMRKMDKLGLGPGVMWSWCAPSWQLVRLVAGVGKWRLI